MRDERVHDLTELAERLGRAGAVVAQREEENVLELAASYGRRTPMIVRWRPGQRIVQITQPLEITATGDDVARMAVVVARINQWLPNPALALDLEARSIEYRTRLFADVDGGLDFELFEQLLCSTLRNIERLVPFLDECLRGEAADLEAMSHVPAPWPGYTE